MGQAFLYRVFGLGGLPKRQRKVLEQQGLVMIDEGLSGWITLKNFRGPGRYSSYRKRYFVGSIALTQRRFLAYQWRTPVINVPLEREFIDKLECCAKGGGIEVAFDAAEFNPKHSGSIAVFFASDRARVFIDRLYGSL